MNSFEYHFLGISKSYRSSIVIKDARIKVSNAQCTLLIGENGTGKTTLLKIMSGLEKPDVGMVRIDGQDVKWGRSKNRLLKNMMYLHQQPYMLDGSVRNNLEYILKVNGLSVKQNQELILQAIEWAGIERVIDQDAKHLSGGEKQRVAIARAYLRNPQVVLLDEPTANLDQASRVRTLALLKQLKASGIAMIIASHDPDLFAEFQDERLNLAQGKLTNLKPRAKRDSVTPIQRYQSKSA